MSLSAASIRRMVEAGASSEVIAIAAEEVEARDQAEAQRKAKRAAQKARERALSRDNVATVARQSLDIGATVALTGSLPPEKETSPTPPKEKLTPIPPSPQGTQARGSRLPDDWRPSDEGLQAAFEALGSNAAHAELAKFRDHWFAKAGADARKVNWDATWRNWFRRAAERQPRGPPSSTAEPKLSPRLSALRSLHREYTACNQTHESAAGGDDIPTGTDASGRQRGIEDWPVGA